MKRFLDKRFFLSVALILTCGSTFAQQAPSKGQPDQVYGTPQASAQTVYVPRAVQMVVAVPQIQYVQQPQVVYQQVVAQPVVQVAQVAVQHCVAVQQVQVQAVNSCAVVQAQGRVRNSKVVTKTVTKTRGGGILSRIF